MPRGDAHGHAQHFFSGVRAELIYSNLVCNTKHTVGFVFTRASIQSPTVYHVSQRRSACYQLSTYTKEEENNTLGAYQLIFSALTSTTMNESRYLRRGSAPCK